MERVDLSSQTYLHSSIVQLGVCQVKNKEVAVGSSVARSCPIRQPWLQHWLTANKLGVRDQKGFGFFRRFIAHEVKGDRETIDGDDGPTSEADLPPDVVQVSSEGVSCQGRLQRCRRTTHNTGA